MEQPLKRKTKVIPRKSSAVFGIKNMNNKENEINKK
jgi:hypothetical protein